MAVTADCGVKHAAAPPASVHCFVCKNNGIGAFAKGYEIIFQYVSLSFPCHSFDLVFFFAFPFAVRGRGPLGTHDQTPSEVPLGS